MIDKVSRNALRNRRRERIRKKIAGTGDCPRLSVFRSIKHIYAQLIDDGSQRTVVSASSLEEGFSGESLSRQDMAKRVGELVAERALGKGIESAVFDRSGYKYHGRIRALADGAREKGLKF
ncbi:MAG: 50S ribosomal protein L18 [Armatimonadetes bacterium]|nr:50S ribosomal protein L18 [Armatimonadota bacterium]